MHIIGTQNLKKKTLDLYSVKLQITAGQVLPVNDNDFFNPDIQIAYKMKLIEVEGEIPTAIRGIIMDEKEDRSDVYRIIKCKNIHQRPISIICLERSVAPGEEFSIPEKDLNTADMRAAVGKKMIQVIEASGQSTDYEEANVKLDQLLKNKTAKPNKSEDISEAQQSLVKAMQKKKERLETNEEIKHAVEAEDKITWNRLSKKPIETKKSPKPKSSLQDAVRTSTDSQSIKVQKETPKIKTIETPPLNVIDDSNPPPISAKDIDDPRKGMVVVNQKGKPVIKESMTAEQINEIIFSDKEEEKERIKKHPILSKKAAKQNEEVDFVG